MKLLSRLFVSQLLANISDEALPEQQIFANIIAIGGDGWAQLAPFGDFYNTDSTGKRVIQRFQRPDAEMIVNEFNGALNLPQRLLGLPWYIGHPDHPRFKGIHVDSKAYGRIKKLEIRDDGLYANVKFGSDGQRLVADEAFHGHSVNWRAIPKGSERGMTIFRPVSLKSVGFTNDPQIPALPVTMANDALSEDELANNMIVIPGKLKVLAGFKADDDCTIEQIIAAIEAQRNRTDKPNNLMNEKPTILKIGDKEVSLHLANAEAETAATTFITGVVADLNAAKTTSASVAALTTQLANERKRSATHVVDKAITEGRLVGSKKDETITLLCNAGDNFDTECEKVAKAAVTIKVKSVTGALGTRGGEVLANVADRQAKFDSLIRARQSANPDESYDVTFANVASSTEGASILEQMNVAKQERQA